MIRKEKRPNLYLSIIKGGGQKESPIRRLIRYSNLSGEKDPCFQRWAKAALEQEGYECQSDGNWRKKEDSEDRYKDDTAEKIDNFFSHGPTVIDSTGVWRAVKGVGRYVKGFSKLDES